VNSGAKAPRRQTVPMADMQKAALSAISNGGVYWLADASPILNPPQSGILGMHKIQDPPPCDQWVRL